MCADYDKKVIVQIGFGNFCISWCDLQPKCPTCDILISEEKFTNFGFYECTYSIYKSSGCHEIKDAQTESLKFHTFEEHEDNISKWKYLLITCIEK